MQIGKCFVELGYSGSQSIMFLLEITRLYLYGSTAAWLLLDVLDMPLFAFIKGSFKMKCYLNRASLKKAQKGAWRLPGTYKKLEKEKLSNGV